ncbi:16S rRNA (adenine(1518)-N(6)/adenine(1519)-N(6))-dimethyltransferase RsmA [Acidimicrobiales bacterium]|nr:16S rRNA (adenine(1518)-N(6)/adenine(1519)-N(6))-dimethyltransferase RsmA [Acidimicrobiales bacterium]
MRPPPPLSAEPSQHGAKGTADLLTRFGLHPDKSLGQHFLVDPNQIDRIVRLARVKPGDHVVEVGPGLGALTAGLAGAGCNVVAVEVDEGLVGALQAQFGTNDAVRVVHDDALKVDWDQVTPADKSWAMVANLPYNVATPLVLDVLDDVPQVKSLLVMVQREVAERLVAGPGSSTYGIPSVKVAYWATGELVAKVPASVFLPPPRVESALVRLVRHKQPLYDEPIGPVFELVRAAFGKRRKMLRKSLSGLVTPEQFAAAGVASDSRPEQIGVEQWCALAKARRLAS